MPNVCMWTHAWVKIQYTVFFRLNSHLYLNMAFYNTFIKTVYDWIHLKTTKRIPFIYLFCFKLSLHFIQVSLVFTKCLFTVPSSHPGYHIMFSFCVSLSYSWMEQFVRIFLFVCFWWAYNFEKYESDIL